MSKDKRGWDNLFPIVFWIVVFLLIAHWLGWWH